ncbi:Kinase D-interacting substrate of 220 kDa [Symbiodinium microadriaticum]|uniref:Kinase D-interacting substrate of 220 kDa n=1 Tax=Symbiodinium microadriaticum TaxID=2951 RepID=A0A1Q9EY23_SYMMI|nr:Kinase D-interacting substrate of 220 kDa [Symbiodinium microadriaticum]
MAGGRRKRTAPASAWLERSLEPRVAKGCGMRVLSFVPLGGLPTQPLQKVEVVGVVVVVVVVLMLNVWNLSGEMVTSIPVEELEKLGTVRGLKQHLHQLNGLARFRQRLLLHGETLEDTAMLHAPMDVHLVVLPFVDISPEDNALVAAASRGSMAEVESLLQLPQDPDLRDFWRGRTALFCACCEGHVEIVRLLLEAGANTGAKSSGYTALIFSSKEGHIEIVRLLLEAGADLEAGEPDNCTPLIWASDEGHAEVVHLLLEADADLDRADDHGHTALMRASRAGHVEIVRLLLEAGANKDASDDCGYTALMSASVAGHFEIVRLLLEAGTSKDVADNCGYTAVMGPSGTGHVEIVRLLLEAGTNKDAADDTGCTSLMRASRHGHVNVVRLLLEHGANHDLADNYGYTAEEQAPQETTEKLKPEEEMGVVRGASKWKKGRPLFEHGNYSSYYGYRHAPGQRGDSDRRLLHLTERFGKSFFKKKEVLDIGCNAGLVSLAVAREFQARRVVGMDLDADLIEAAEANYSCEMDNLKGSSIAEYLDYSP